MASDWTLLRKKYPTLSEAPTYDEVKAVVREAHAHLGLNELADARQTCEDEKDVYDRQAACLGAEVTVFEALICEAMERANADSVRTTKGVTFRIDSIIDAKVQADGGAAKLRAWIAANNMQEMLSVNGNALSKMVRDRVDADLELPDGVDAVPRHKLRATGRANKDT